MPIKKVKNSTEKYREIAKSGDDPHTLTGRGSNKDLTVQRVQFVSNNVRLLNTKFNCILDVGCGNGAFLDELRHLGAKCIGILPSTEECQIVSQLLTHDNVTIERGISNNLPCEGDSIDLLLCNSVLHGIGFDQNLVRNSLREFHRVLRKGAILYIGEIPELNEMDGRNYGTSFILYCLWVLKNRGVITMLRQVRDYIHCALTNRIYTIQPTNMFFLQS